METLLYDTILDGNSLAKEVLEDMGTITDNKGKEYWWNTIDKSKKYRVRKYEHERALQDYSTFSYKINEI